MNQNVFILVPATLKKSTHSHTLHQWNFFFSQNRLVPSIKGGQFLKNIHPKYIITKEDIEKIFVLHVYK